MDNITLTDKQKEYVRNARQRWCFKVGATGAGKTFIDCLYVIPKRIIERKGQPGLSVIMGVTRETIERNILQPMRGYYGSLIGEINNRNLCKMFGEDVYCLGAEKANQVSKIQGATFKYLYCDEVVRWNEEVFNFAKSRLRSPVSLADATCNPEGPSHYIKKFLDGNADIYCQHYIIDDNPFYPEREKEALKKEYAGTIYFDRYILGLWKQAEGAIYTHFSNDPAKYFIHSKDLPKNRRNKPDFNEINVGLDFGGTKSGHAFVASGITDNYEKLIALKSQKYMNKDYINGITPQMIDGFAVKFVGEVIDKYGRCDNLYWDNESTVLGNGVKQAVESAYPQVLVQPCYKATIKERIDLKVRLIGQERYFYTEDCETLKQATMEAVYDKTKQVDARLDDFTSDIDTLDAEEYAFTRNMNRFIKTQSHPNASD